MSSRSDAWRCAALVVFVLVPLVTSAQPATTPWGDPDLQGIWTNFDLGEGYSLEAPVPFGSRPARLLGGTGTCIPSSEPLPRPVGALHHARHPGLGVSVALQQRLLDTAGSGIRRHPLRNDS